MSFTTSTVVAQAGVSNGANATTTGSFINVSDAYDKTLLVLITNQTTGPTLPCTARVDFSPDGGTTVYPGAGGYFTAGVAGGFAQYAAAFPLPSDTRYVRVVFTGNTGQPVAVQADITKVTAL